MIIRILIFLTLLVAATAVSVLSTGQVVGAFVEQKIETSNVIVFSKSYCPFCKKTKALLMQLEESLPDEVGVEYIELDQLPGADGSMIQGYLQGKTGQRTVPNVFIDKQHVGGNSDLQQLHAVGKLEAMLKEVSTSKAEL